MKKRSRCVVILALLTSGCTAAAVDDEHSSQSKVDTPSTEVMSLEQQLNSRRFVTVQMRQGRFDLSPPKFETVELPAFDERDMAAGVAEETAPHETVMRATFSANNRDVIQSAQLASAGDQ